MLHAVIMAGGSGTRFWPASTSARPKQLLDLAGERTMIQASVERLGAVVPPDRILVITNQSLVDAIAEQLPQLSREAIIGEPCKRDTAPCIGLGAALIAARDPEAVMAVMPADHVIHPDTQFQAAIRAAAALVERRPEQLVTFGIRPSYPAESFGYIECRREQRLDESWLPPGLSGYPVAQFREKPDASLAREFLASGNFYWNSGIFVWRARTILDALARYEPELHGRVVTIADSASSGDFPAVLAHEFPAIRGKSIDYAVMEHYEPVVVIEATFAWDDLGSWRSIARLRGEDAVGNTVIGRHLGIDTSGTIVRSDDQHLVVTLGVSDLIVVHTPAATLIAHRDREESIRQVVEALKEKGWSEYL